MTDNFFSTSTDIVVDIYDNTVLCVREDKFNSAVFDKLLFLYRERSIVQVSRHYSECRICGCIARIYDDAITECLISVEYKNFSIKIPATYLHLHQNHNFDFSKDMSELIISGDENLYNMYFEKFKINKTVFNPDPDIDDW